MAVKTLRLNLSEASKFSSDITGNSDRVIQKWALEFLLSYSLDEDNLDESFFSNNRGKHNKVENSLVTQEDFIDEARQFIRENANKRGQPNLTCKDFAGWVSNKWQVDIAEETARRWMHKLGFEQKRIGKSVYFDGHERDDIVEARQEYLKTLEESDLRAYGSSTVLQQGEKALIRLYHDESIYYVNACQTFYWNDGTNTSLKQKSLGQAIMVSDFIEEVDGFLKFGNLEARELLEHQKDSYFDNDKFVNQVLKAVDIFNAKYPNAQGLFIFDNAPSHCNLPNDALNVSKMNVGSGGRQPVTRNTYFHGKQQMMTLLNGQPKGMRMVLEERGIRTNGINASRMREELLKFDDFKRTITYSEGEDREYGSFVLVPPKIPL